MLKHGVPFIVPVEADRRRGGKTISKSGQEWTLPAQLGMLKTGQDGEGLLQIHRWCPNDLPRLWDRIEYEAYDSLRNQSVDSASPNICSQSPTPRIDAYGINKNRPSS